MTPTEIENALHKLAAELSSSVEELRAVINYFVSWGHSSFEEQLHSIITNFHDGFFKEEYEEAQEMAAARGYTISEALEEQANENRSHYH